MDNISIKRVGFSPAVKEQFINNISGILIENLSGYFAYPPRQLA
jgi:hypothetical protein